MILFDFCCADLLDWWRCVSHNSLWLTGTLISESFYGSLTPLSYRNAESISSKKKVSKFTETLVSQLIFASFSRKRAVYKSSESFSRLIECKIRCRQFSPKKQEQFSLCCLLFGAFGGREQEESFLSFTFVCSIFSRHKFAVGLNSDALDICYQSSCVTHSVWNSHHLERVICRAIPRMCVFSVESMRKINNNFI